VKDNYRRCQEVLGLTRDDLHALVRNSFTASFLDDPDRKRYLAMVDDCFARS
jgi:adenosine deaminase